MAVPLSEDDLGEMEARCLAATPGPWVSYVEGRDHASGSSFIRTGAVGGGRGEDIELTGATDHDQDFIAHARQDLPLLIEEVRRLRSRLGSI